MFVLIHENGCGDVCYKRELMPELSTPLDEKYCFNLDGSPVERAQAVICQSCGLGLKLSEVHPRYWREE